MRLGIVGPYDSVMEAKKYVCSTGLVTNIVELVYEKFTDIPEVMAAKQKNVDTVLFTGVVPFNYAVRFVSPNCPWYVVPKDKLSLVFALLKAGFINRYDITHVSVDSYGDLIFEAYRDLNYSSDDVYVALAPNDIFAENYLADILKFHIAQYRAGKTKCAFTGLEIVYKKLKEQKIPCMMISKVFDAVLNELNKLLIGHKGKEKNKNRFSVMFVQINYMEEHPAFKYNVLQMLNLKNVVKDKIYIFAQKTGAAIFEQTEGVFSLCLDKETLYAETEGYQKLQLLQEIAKNELVKDVHIGIGEGPTAFEALQYARIGEQHAKALDCNSAFIVEEDNKFRGPIVCDDNQKGKEFIENDFSTVARQSGVSIQSISKFYSIVKQFGINTITPKELAKLYGCSERNMNRILCKLEDAGYVEYVGKKIDYSVGRPSKIIKIKLGI